ncbi:MAG: GlsB/YeaQ/YmgE family stress response membrane protein [Chloroflexales bacterium]|nr:GlsB/YeaQ/YmgE family stress response membrane protein [Chloroflexales bacterium]
MGFLSWILFGAIVGWIASIIAGTNDRQGCVLNIVVGIVGAFIGGAAMTFINQGQPFDFGFDLASFVVAIIGSLILLALVRAARGQSR